MITATQIKILVCGAVLAAWTYGAYYTGEQLERAEWERKESEKKDEVIEFKDNSAKDSQDSGQKYEAKKATILGKLYHPNQGLEDEMQGPAGSVELPASLGVRLNELSGARQAKPAASQPDAGVRGTDPVP